MAGRRSAAGVRDAQSLHPTEPHLCGGARQWRLFHGRWRKGDDVDDQIIHVPDVYGVYKFRLFYQRQGVSFINENTQVSIRPFKHNEFPRFILAAYPYYVK